QFARALAYWCYRADPDGREDEAADDYKARRIHLSDAFRGTKVIDGQFEPIGGAIFGAELNRIEQELFEEDWADARARLGAKAWLERVVFGAPSRVIDIGVRRRLFTGATRRAVQVRDRECFHEFCDTPADDCQIDHIEPYAAGGLTTQDNGRSACAFHNRERE